MLSLVNYVVYHFEVLICKQTASYQSGTLPIWVTLSRLPKQVTLNMNFSQQLPKWVTVSVYEQLPKL